MPDFTFSRGLSSWAWLCLCAAAIALGASAPATCQERNDEDNQPPVVSQPQQATNVENRNGFVSDSAVGRAGERQVRDKFAGIEPMARIGNRFTNRVQNRIRNRIDRYYDPNSSTTSPFVVAADQVKTADPRSRR